jgi:phage tail sheath protein FI
MCFAYQKTLTALNNLHVRDLLITIEEGVEDILSNYVFEFNDAPTRLEIKTIVDGYLANIKSSGGIYDYIIIMDESNNTTEVIDQNIGIIDIGIEPARGLQKIINRVTVLKTGTVSSGGFTVA